MSINSIEIDNQHAETGLVPLKIGKYTLETPVIQGGMGIGVSLSELAGNVSLNGGAGTIASGAIQRTPAYKEFRKQRLKRASVARIEAKKAKEATSEKWSRKDNKAFYAKVFRDANAVCIGEEIWKAKTIAGWEPNVDGKDMQTGKGPVFINIMSAAKDYEAHVKASCEAGVHGIVSGAGLPLRLPEYVDKYKNKDADIALIPILSSLKGVETLMKFWKTKYNKYPDAIVLEDPSRAGGHLGADKGKLENVYNASTALETVVPAVLKYLKDLKSIDPNCPDIPVIAAGGIVTREDADRMFKLGAKGVQLGTRFLASEESNAHPDFKNNVINAKPEDVGIYNSSAIYPARCLMKSLEGKDFKGETCKEKIEGETAHECRKCLAHCALKDGIPGYAQVCLEKELGHSLEGSRGDGIQFIGYPFTKNKLSYDKEGKKIITLGTNKIRSILPVKEIFENFKLRKN